MKHKLQTIWRKNFASQFQGRTGLHAFVFLNYMVLVELFFTGVWFESATLLVAFDKLLFQHKIISANEALIGAVVIVFGLAAAIYGFLLGTEKGKRLMLAVAEDIDRMVIKALKALFCITYLFLSISYIKYVLCNISFQTRIPPFPDMPPRHHLS